MNQRTRQPERRRRYRAGAVFLPWVLLVLPASLPVAPVSAQDSAASLTLISSWTHVPAGRLSGPPVWTRDGRMLFAGEDRRLYALAGTGARLWRTDLERLPATTVAAGRDGSAYLGLNPNVVTAITPAGRVRWSIAGPDAPVSVIPSPDGVVYVVWRNGAVTARTVRGAAVWAVQMAAPVTATPVVTEGGLLVVATDDGSLTAFDVLGNRRRLHRFPAPVTALAAGERLFAGDRAGGLHGISPNGSLLWSQRPSESPVRDVLLDGSQGLVVRTDDGFLLAVSTTGTTRWQARPPGTRITAAALTDEGAIYSGTSDGRLVVLDREGRLLADHFTGRPAAIQHVGITRGGRVVTAGDDWVLHGWCVHSCAQAGPRPALWGHPRGGPGGTGVSPFYQGRSIDAYRNVLDFIFLEQAASSDSPELQRRALVDIEARVAEGRVGTAYVYVVELLVSMAMGGPVGRGRTPVAPPERERAMVLLGELGDHTVSARFARLLQTESVPLMQSAILSMMGAIESDPDGDVVTAVSAFVQREGLPLASEVGLDAVATLASVGRYNRTEVRIAARETLVGMSASVRIPARVRAAAALAVRTLE